MRRRTFAAQVIWIGISACAMRASAQTSETLRVERGPGAESCPDAAELEARVEAIRQQPNTANRPYTITFQREGRLYSAQLRADSSSLRSLESRADDCEALAKATAVTLALLYDSLPPPLELEPEPEPEPEPAPPPPPPSAAPPPDRPNPTQLGLALGAGLAAGILSPFAPALLAELALRHDALHFALGVAWLPEQHVQLSPGTSDLSLISANARACYALLRRPWLRLEGCSGALLGSLSAAASGYTRDAPTSHHFYAALPVELTLGQGLTHASWELSATLLIPYRRNQFEIDGLGSVYDTPAVSGVLSLRAAGWLEL